MPFYATYTGHIQSGVFTTWDECKKEIHKKPKYKKFNTLAEAEDFQQNGPATIVGSETDDFDIVVYTDGACSKNGSKNATAGYGIYFSEGNPKNVSKRLTSGKLTNNVAELTAVIEAIKLVSDSYGKKIGIYTDSKYTMLCASSFGAKCLKKKWAPDIPNVDLVKELYTLVNQHSITLLHVSAHTTNDDVHSVGNREADRLATQCIYNLLI
jgi:ribonuclease HI